MPYYSPLRYPGGKRRLAPTVAEILDATGLGNVHYVEPYAGGAAVALSLLFEERARTIHINDLNPAVHAFWKSALEFNNELCERIEETPVTMEQWHKQRAVYLSEKQPDTLDLGFAAFFLNRTNRSGILGGGVIGGSDQKGRWKLDARYNKDNLIDRIKRIGRYRNRIKLSNEDALKFVQDIEPTLPESTFIFFDPPYIENGDDLYMNAYTVDDHRQLALEIAKIDRPWIVTYDSAAAKENLFPGHRQVVYALSYSAQARYDGGEVMFMSSRLKMPAAWNETNSAFVLSQTGPRQVMGTLMAP